MSEEIKEVLDEEELEDAAGGKKHKKDKKYDKDKCLVCMEQGKMNVRTRKKGDIWECEAGHKFKSAGNHPNWEQRIY